MLDKCQETVLPFISLKNKQTNKDNLCCFPPQSPVWRPWWTSALGPRNLIPAQPDPSLSSVLGHLLLTGLLERPWTRFITSHVRGCHFTLLSKSLPPNPVFSLCRTAHHGWGHDLKLSPPLFYCSQTETEFKSPNSTALIIKTSLFFYNKLSDLNNFMTLLLFSVLDCISLTLFVTFIFKWSPTANSKTFLVSFVWRTFKSLW